MPLQTPFLADVVESYEKVLDGATSGTLTLTVPAVVTPYTVTLPAAQGSAGQGLVNDGSGNLSWATPTDVDAFALQDLSNLTNPTSVNQTLTPAADITESLGTALKRWLNGFIKSIFTSGISSTAVASNNLAGTAVLASGTATVVFATPEADTNYRISLAGNANFGFWWSAKTVSGFTINASSGKQTPSVDWLLLR